jgi:WD40 repeat protein
VQRLLIESFGNLTPVLPTCFSSVVQTPFLVYPPRLFLSLFPVRFVVASSITSYSCGTVGSVDGTMRLYHLGGKRSLQIFVHCRPKSAAESAMKPIKEAENSDDEEMLRLEQEETFSVECVGFATNGMRWVASGGLDSTLKVWDLDNGSLRCTCVHSSVVTQLQWHSVHPIVFTSTVGGSVCVWDARAGLQLSEYTGHRAQITHFSIRPVTTERGPMEAVVTASDDHTSRVFLVDYASLL